MRLTPRHRAASGSFATSATPALGAGVHHEAVAPAIDQEARQWSAEDEEHDRVSHAYSISCSVSYVKAIDSSGIGPNAE
jgi:hypothetical protein